MGRLNIDLTISQTKPANRPLLKVSVVCGPALWCRKFLLPKAVFDFGVVAQTSFVPVPETAIHENNCSCF